MDVIKTNVKPDRVLEIIKEAGILRPRDLDAYHIPGEYLQRLYKRGLVVGIGDRRKLFPLSMEISKFKGKFIKSIGSFCGVGFVFITKVIHA